ncbi:MAG TPA: hypothetical protein VE915_02035 [Actinomycetota bacterium]|nr:hypothetical protein [Actinomycetota bacterium]
MRGRTPAKLLLLGIAALLVLAACGGGGDGDGATPTALPSPVEERPPSPAKLSLVEPESGAVLAPEAVRVRLELTGATLTKEVSRNLRPDEGHIHLRLDGETITLLGDLDENLAEILGEPVASGPHLLEAEFVAADHGPFDPRIIVSVPFTVE